MECKSYIDGKWVSGTDGRIVALGNPADTRRVISRSVHVGSDEAVHAINRAANAWDKWCKTTIEQRVSFLEQIIDRVI
ncbi:MAG: aldehyde dehydrogenase family protein, partial [Emcibacter sp.]|nr:aldehyde dehydrogenase family protein [Emcibacter sp.]